jgi:Flp pilus assembly pilin Flp
LAEPTHERHQRAEVRRRAQPPLRRQSLSGKGNDITKTRRRVGQHHGDVPPSHPPEPTFVDDDVELVGVQRTLQKVREERRTGTDEDTGATTRHPAMESSRSQLVIHNIDDSRVSRIINLADHEHSASSHHASDERTSRSASRRDYTTMLNVIHIVLSQLAARVRNDDRGEVSLEYVLVGGLMAAAIVLGMATLSPAVSGWFVAIGGIVTGALPG